MYKFITFLLLVIAGNFALIAEQRPIIIHNSGTTNNHLEHYAMADMPDAVYYDSESGEIVIEADGTSLCNVSVQFLKYCHLKLKILLYFCK